MLGDLVGYGGDPNAVCERVRELAPHALIRGNHDKVGSGIETPDGFNAVARSAIRWTFDTLTDENREWLAALPAGPVDVDDAFEICHGTPFDEDAYVFDDLDALRALHAARRPLCLFGHTHVQVGHSLSAQPVRGRDQRRRTALRHRAQARHQYLINPGSVGQPRDGDPRAGFAIVDTDDGDGDDPPHRLPDRQGAGADRRGRAAGHPRRAAGGRALTRARASIADCRMPIGHSSE